jgi:hypothetical protein
MWINTTWVSNHGTWGVEMMARMNEAPVYHEFVEWYHGNRRRSARRELRSFDCGDDTLAWWATLLVRTVLSRSRGRRALLRICV